jgi:serine/threonine protein kinase
MIKSATMALKDMSALPHKFYDPEDPRVEVLYGDISGQYLQTYLIGSQLGKGSFGSVFEATEHKTQTGHVVKISKDFIIMGKEIQALKAFHGSKPKEGAAVPHVLAYGMFSNIVDRKKNLYSFYVMPRYGKDIESFFQE